MGNLPPLRPLSTLSRDLRSIPAPRKSPPRTGKACRSAGKNSNVPSKSHTQGGNPNPPHEDRSAEVKKQLQENADAFLPQPSHRMPPCSRRWTTALGAWPPLSKATSRIQTSAPPPPPPLSDWNAFAKNGKGASRRPHQASDRPAALKTAQDSVTNPNKPSHRKTDEASASKEARKSPCCLSIRSRRSHRPRRNLSPRTVTARPRRPLQSVRRKNDRANKLAKPLTKPNAHLRPSTRHRHPLRRARRMDGPPTRLDQGETPRSLSISRFPAARRALIGDSPSAKPAKAHILEAQQRTPIPRQPY